MAEKDTIRPTGEESDEAMLDALQHDTEPPSEPTSVVDMGEVIREHEEFAGACLYWQNVQAMHELAAMRAR